eukprot:15116602-Alexandrium_andersonii.AAC.1
MRKLGAPCWPLDSAPELPSPAALRASLFDHVPNRDVDVALGIHERRVEAARQYAARAAGAKSTPT